ncbi:MAG: hypothetical protein CME62_17825 [Halobacteriovoraceae bacterium]|nr:hypothetical protein [Halobacteriovoraceae bacterium]|tara:strand:+ start:10396 stop:11367 length:972 start_codon:yes stop_codon:yes gene_type:complete
MNLQVYRTDSSSYQDSHFLAKEQKILESIPGVSYVKSLSQTQKEIPFVLITNTHTQIEHIPKTILDRTKLLVHPNSGYDNIGDEFVKKCSFPIVKGNPIRANAVAEYMLSCVFKEIAQVPNHLHWSSTRVWKRPLLRDQKVLIIGNGHIGQLLKNSLRPLVSQLTVYDPFTKELGVENEFSHELFSKVNILLIAADLNDTSYHMVEKVALNELAKKNIIINPARGGIIKEEDLFDYLQQNSNSKCYLDVFEEEPFKAGFQAKLSNLNKTSHIAGVFDRLNQDIISFEYLIIKDFLEKLASDNSQTFYQDYSDCILNHEPTTIV